VTEGRHASRYALELCCEPLIPPSGNAFHDGSERLYTGCHEHNSWLGAFFVSARGRTFAMLMRSAHQATELSLKDCAK
jgi:hypothetical protein